MKARRALNSQEWEIMNSDEFVPSSGTSESTTFAINQDTRTRRMDGRTVAKTVSAGYLAGQTDRRTDKGGLLGGVEPTFSSRIGRIVWEAIAICFEDASRTTTKACGTDK